MEPQQIIEQAQNVLARAEALAQEAAALAQAAEQATLGAAGHAASGGYDGGFFLSALTVFVLACFVGYYVVWRVTPALHSPLMAVTNAVSSVIIVGALIAAGPAQITFSSIMGFIAVVLASVNIFGGFIVTRRMLAMYKKKQR